MNRMTLFASKCPGLGYRQIDCEIIDLNPDLMAFQRECKARELQISGVRRRVVQAWMIQAARFHESVVSTNPAMVPRQVKAHCKVDSVCKGYLEHAMEEMNIFARAHDRILKVARTLADLADSMDIRPNDTLETSSSVRWTGSSSVEPP